MKSSLRERLGRLGPIRVIAPSASGSPADAVLHVSTDHLAVNTIAAALALQTHAGLTMLKAKHLLEGLLVGHPIEVELPRVANQDELQARLAEAGFKVSIHLRPFENNHEATTKLG